MLGPVQVVGACLQIQCLVNILLALAHGPRYRAVYDGARATAPKDVGFVSSSNYADYFT